ncbi:hypothetical protein [Mesorhizobium denitrificans]|uniref:Uncharacterized protein n=1 Tax=Mesorhizobium denitrificans TaxID=2294114 RepID=A0A371XEZ9_9HYPH|nr:hypothetical protein [Mesorhizobium denitrificans]RFC67796.1 hypothetical protein DY251_09390 [Mesorhizobium denitrificans]
MTIRDYDLTQVFDPSDLWPNENDCPDYPIFENEQSRTMNPPFTRQDAMNSLMRIRYTLNKGTEDLRPPSKAEAEEAKARYFKSGTPTNWRWNNLGLGHLQPARLDNDDADLIVTAVHLRGFIRKIDAKLDRKLDERADRERAARSALADYAANAPRVKAELDSLAEAAARHQQRMGDEQAFYRTQELRRSLSELQTKATAAAKTLGVDLPAI